jgi:hypothetical protein
MRRLSDTLLLQPHASELYRENATFNAVVRAVQAAEHDQGAREYTWAEEALCAGVVMMARTIADLQALVLAHVRATTLPPYTLAIARKAGTSVTLVMAHASVDPNPSTPEPVESVTADPDPDCDGRRAEGE